MAAHEKGEVQDAKRLYQAVLQVQPNHPDASHNLGILAVSVKKADAAGLLLYLHKPYAFIDLINRLSSYRERNIFWISLQRNYNKFVNAG